MKYFILACLLFTSALAQTDHLVDHTKSSSTLLKHDSPPETKFNLKHFQEYYNNHHAHALDTEELKDEDATAADGDSEGDSESEGAPAPASGDDAAATTDDTADSSAEATTEPSTAESDTPADTTDSTPEV